MCSSLLITCDCCGEMTAATCGALAAPASACAIAAAFAALVTEAPSRARKTSWANRAQQVAEAEFERSASALGGEAHHYDGR
jgi:hypothetical protein